MLIYKADVWSAGIVLYVMIVGEFPFPNKNNLLLLFEDIAKGNYKIPSWIQDSMLKDLLKKLLTVDPQKRISIDEILEHPWLDCDLPRHTLVPIDPAPSLFGHDSRTVEASAKRMKKQLESEARERAENGILDEEEDDSEDTSLRSISRGRFMMTRSIDDLRNRSRATSRNPSKSPPARHESDADTSDDDERGHFTDDFDRSSSLSASASSSGKGSRRQSPKANQKRKPGHKRSQTDEAKDKPEQANRSPRKSPRKTPSSAEPTRRNSKRTTRSDPASPSSSTSHATSNSDSSATPNNESSTNTTPKPASLRDSLGRSKSQSKRCNIM